MQNQIQNQIQDQENITLAPDGVQAVPSRAYFNR
jgi:hypothetical protein